MWMFYFISGCDKRAHEEHYSMPKDQSAKRALIYIYKYMHYANVKGTERDTVKMAVDKNNSNIYWSNIRSF